MDYYVRRVRRVLKDSCRRNHEGLLYVETLSADGAREQPLWSTYRAHMGYCTLYTEYI